MFPYWMLGAFMIWATKFAGYGRIVRIEKKAVVKWIIILIGVTIFRLLTIKFLLGLDFFSSAAKAVKLIPWQATLTVFWEDAAFGLPLFLTYLYARHSKWLKYIWYVLLAVFTLAFGAGHIYQSYFAAAILMFYIPYSLKLGYKYGFGTVMICHILYDLFTILTVKWALGIL